MKEALADIRKRLQTGVYRNEEHVRLALVARLLQKLGWDIWNPAEVNAEFVVVPAEDNTKVDFALFLNPQTPAVYIEVKAVGKLGNLPLAERQLRDYNRNNTALFCVITDGRLWRFYYSQTGGEFSDKCFKALDLLADEPEDIEASIAAFLGRTQVEGGTAEKDAQALLKLTLKQRTMEDCLPKAKRLTQEPPYPSLPEAMMILVKEQGYTITREEAVQVISAEPIRKPPPPPPPPVQEGGLRSQEGSPDSGLAVLPPKQPGSLRFTTVYGARIGSEHASNWNALVEAGIRLAVARGYRMEQFRRILPAHLEVGDVVDRGFHPMPGTGMSLQYMQADRAWESALALAEELKCPVEVKFRWQPNDRAAYPGRDGLLRWTP